MQECRKVGQTFSAKDIFDDFVRITHNNAIVQSSAILTSIFTIIGEGLLLHNTSVDGDELPLLHCSCHALSHDPHDRCERCGAAEILPLPPAAGASIFSKDSKLSISDDPVPISEPRQSLIATCLGLGAHEAIAAYAEFSLQRCQ